MNVLLTGASGHIGNAIARKLEECGHKVICVLRSPALGDVFEGISAECVYGSLEDIQFMESLVSRTQAVIHCAGVIDLTSAHKKMMRHVNVDISLSIARLCMKHGVRFIYISSVNAVWDKPGDNEICEPEQFDENSISGAYGKTKAEASRRLMAMCSEGLDGVILMPSGVAGPYNFKNGNFDLMIKRYAERKMPAYIKGRYNFVDVRDLSSAAEKALTSAGSGECYLLSGEVLSVKELMSLMEKATGIPSPSICIPYFIAYAFSYAAVAWCVLMNKNPLFSPYALRTLKTDPYFSSKKAHDELGFSVTPMEITVRDTYAFMKKKGLINTK